MAVGRLDNVLPTRHGRYIIHPKWVSAFKKAEYCGYRMQGSSRSSQRERIDSTNENQSDKVDTFCPISRSAASSHFHAAIDSKVKLSSPDTEKWCIERH